MKQILLESEPPALTARTNVKSEHIKTNETHENEMTKHSRLKQKRRAMRSEEKTRSFSAKLTVTELLRQK